MKSKILTVLIILTMTIGIFPMTLNEVKAEGTAICYSEADIDGYIESTHLASPSIYVNATYGSDHPGNIGGVNVAGDQTIHVGQENYLYYTIFKGYLSFNTSTIPANERIISATLNARVYYYTVVVDFNVEIWEIDIGTTLDEADWHIDGTYLTDLFNTTTLVAGEWYDVNIPLSAIGVTRTQFQLNSSRNGTAPGVFTEEVVGFWSGNTSSAPYLTITTVTETEAIMTYNFTSGLNTDLNASICYNWYPDPIYFFDGFESDDFSTGGWTTSGNSFTTLWYNPWNGTYHAGARYQESGVGVHIFQKAINGFGNNNITVAYARYTADAGLGTVNLTIDWYDGTTWNYLESLTDTNAYSYTNISLGYSADNNTDIIVRFRITFDDGNNNNRAFVDDVNISGNSTIIELECPNQIYPVEFLEWNDTAELIRYEIFLDDEDWAILTVNQNLSFISCHPYTNVIDLGGGNFNITERRYDNQYHMFWFMKPLYIDEYYEEIFNIYPVEIIDWNTKDLYRYEFWSKNQSYIWLDMPNASFNYESISPYANVTQVNSTRYNITGTGPSGTFFWIWFTFNKTALCPTFVSMYREVTNEGIIWNTWVVYYNEGSWTDPANMTRLSDQHIDLVTSLTYCFSVYDYFPTPNLITNYTIVATCGTNETLFVDIPVPYSPLNFKSFRDDLSVFRIWYQAGGNPFTDHIPAYEWYQMDIRGGQYMIAIDYIDTTVNGTITILNTFFINITADSNYAYTINIGESQLTTIVTNVNGLAIAIEYQNTFIIGAYILNRSVMPITITDPTRSIASFNADLPILIHPYSVVDAEVYSNYSGVTSATFFDPTPDDPGTITIITDEINVICPFDTQIFINRTDSSTIVNTTFPGVIDLTQYTNSTNITFWSNNTSSLRRQTRFQHASIFNWKYTSSIGQFVTALSLNNTSQFDWRNLHWWVGIPEGILLDTTTKTRLPSIYDLNDKEYWEFGLDYKVDTAGYYVDFAFFNSSTIRDLAFKFYEANATFYPGTATLEINEYWRQGYQEDDYWYGTGTWMNLEVATYKEDLFIVMENMDGRIDESSYIVLDGVTGDRMYNEFLQSSTDTSATIRVTYIDVGDIPPGESIAVEVYFLYESYDLPGFPWLYFLLISLLIISVIAALIIIAKREHKGILIIGSIIVTSLLVIIAMIVVTLGS